MPDTSPLLKLPDEMILLILRRLELEEQANLYSTCHRLSELMSAYYTPHLQSCRLGRGPLATVDTLSLPFFRKFGSRVKQLDLSCMDLSSTPKLLPALERMTNITTLDVSRTNLNLLDLQHVYKACPRLKIICADFLFLALSMTMETKIQIKNTFGVLLNMERIHFVSTIDKNNPAYNYFSQNIKQLNLKKLKEFQFTCNHQDSEPSLFKSMKAFYKTNQSGSKVLKFHFNLERLAVPMYFNMQAHIYSYQFMSENWDYIFISFYDKYPKIIMSYKLNNFYRNSDCKLSCDVSTEFHGYKNKWSWYLWSENIVEHNQDFYDKVFRELEKKVAHYICLRTDWSLENYKHHSSNSYCVSPCTFQRECEVEEPGYVPPIKRSRSNQDKLWINIDKFVQADKEVQLTLRRFCDCLLLYEGPISFHPITRRMKDITFFHLDNIAVLLDPNFFIYLFQECFKLKTLNVNNEKNGCFGLIRDAIHLSKSLINLRICEVGVNNYRLYESLSRCQTLQNVHISDMTTSGAVDVATSWFLHFMKACTRLYSFNLFTIFKSSKASADAREQEERLEEGLNGRNVFIKFHQRPRRATYSYVNENNLNPYADVFFSDTTYRSMNVDVTFPPDELA